MRSGAILTGLACPRRHVHARLAVWLGVLVSFVMTLLGPTFGLADWTPRISPFWHGPNIQAAL